MAALLGPKKLLVQHVAYFYNAVLLLRLEFRLQTILFSENTILLIVKPIFSVFKRKAGLATTTPLRNLQPALPLQIILSQSIFQKSWKLWKNLNIFVLAQFTSPCGRYLIYWSNLRYLGIIGKKEQIPTWFTFIMNNFLSFSSSFLFLPLYFINSNFTIASPHFLDESTK
ncbi:hypothetical protein RhiirA5_421480 [Rhizophagus irregularis]|uniref:Uncharacterized protein n=1 Tax=Rhizophagus irregularis TaxID=588596 RepID=A0A2N0PDU2_9GLOM|nr:hypothetical protein RhiirA5_421480 [Rhizophagus irregularis]